MPQEREIGSSIVCPDTAGVVVHLCLNTVDACGCMLNRMWSPSVVPYGVPVRLMSMGVPPFSITSLIGCHMCSLTPGPPPEVAVNWAVNYVLLQSGSGVSG